jgi:hypothetical protein
MSINHENISLALRAVPCDPARADSLLAGICPNQICPVGAAPFDPNANEAAESGQAANPSQLLGTPSPDVIQQLEELSQERQTETNGEASTGNGAEQPGVNATPGSQAGSGEVGGGEAGGNEAEGGAGDTAEGGESTAGAEDETAESGTAPGGEGEAAGETGNEAGTGDSEAGAEGAGSETAAAPGPEAGSEAGAAGESGPAAAEDAANAETGGTAAETESEATANDPAATSQPPEIAPPVESERSPWLWIIVAFAITIIVVGAVLFILSHPGDDIERKGRRQEPATAEAAVDEGRELVAAGNYRGAIRHLFLAALLTLDERNLIHYDKTRTNYELLNEVELRDTITEPLTPVVETFERVWYGFETVGAAEYELLVGQIELLKQA